MSVEKECERAFEFRHKSSAVRLLPLVRRPADIRVETTNDSIPGVWWSYRHVSVSLLHLATVHGWMDVIIDLIKKYKCDVYLKDSDGRTPMHYAAMSQLDHLEVVRYFIMEQHCDPMRKDSFDYTLLHYASHCGHLNIIQYLINDLKCNPSCETEFGDTPLQIACHNGQTHVVQFLLSTGEVNPLAKNKYGKTLVDYVSISSRRESFDVLKMIQSFPQYKKDFPVHTYTKVILTGCSGAGKTTLSQLILLLASESTSFFSLSSGRVTDVECLTAGIIPHNVESKVKKVGNMVIYDFAGQQEYYSSHAAVLECVMGNSAAIFVCIVDLSHCKKTISESIHYWMSFMENAASSSVKQGSSHVIIIGSHADQVKSSQELKEKRSLVESIADNRVKQLTYRGFVSMDCRLSKTKDARHFRSLLSTSQQAVLSSQPRMSLYCHMLYAFLCKKLSMKGCTLQKLTSFLSSKEDISLDSTSLKKSLDSLSEKGLIVFVPNQEDPQSSWVVVEKEALLREVNGKLFAPEDFEQYHKVASNTGVVSIVSLEELFPQYSSEMLVGCLESMEFCHSVDPSMLQGTNLKSNKGTLSPSRSSGASHLFFPSLVKEQRPGDLPSAKFGWCLGCSDPYQFFSNRFLHVLLLRLAFSFPLTCEHLPSFNRRCQVWRNGISWKNVTGVSTIVEIVDHNRWVIVLVSDLSRDSIRNCSSVIRMILNLKEQLCSAVNTCGCECLISPSLLDRYPFDTLPDSNLFPMRDVARSMLHRHKVILDRKNGKNELVTEDALLFEPYYLLQPSSVCQLFNPSMASQPIPDSLLHEVLKYCQQPQQMPQDHKELKECVNKQSIFAGRNPLKVAELNEEDITATDVPTCTAAAGVHDLSRTLGTGDLVDVLEVVESISDWKRLGLNLGLSYQPTLTDIETHRQGRPGECKIDMFSAWLQQKDNVSQKGVPSWGILRAALQKMGENEIADRLMTSSS